MTNVLADCVEAHGMERVLRALQELCSERAATVAGSDAHRAMRWAELEFKIADAALVAAKL